MQTIGSGFSFYFNGDKCKDFDDFEKKTKKEEVTIEIKNLKIYAVSLKR